MKLIYNEIYGIDKDMSIVFPTLELIFENGNENILPNIDNKLIQNDDGFYFANLPFIDGLFSCLSKECLNKLDSLLRFENELLNVEYINRDIWKPFLFTSNIRLLPIKKIVNSNITNSKGKKTFTKDDNQLKIERYYNSSKISSNVEIPILQKQLYKKMKNDLINKDNNNNNNKLRLKYKLRVPSDSFIDVLNIMKIGYWGGAISISYEFEFNNELDLLYTFLDCLFNSEYNFKIKKCKKCDNFFITLKVDHQHCPTCQDIETKSRKIKYESQQIRKLERNIDSLYNSPYTAEEVRKKYQYDKMCKKIEYENDEEKLKNWYLSHYKNEETKKRNDYIVKK